MKTIGFAQVSSHKTLSMAIGLMLGLAIGVLFSASVFTGGSVSADRSDDSDRSERSDDSDDDSDRNTRTILEFDTMVGNPEPYVGITTPIRGINAGGVPWQIARAEGELKSNGKIEIKVKGLVLFEGAPVPEARQGTNPSATFRAIVSCLSVDGDGNASTVKVMTAAFPASPDGNSKIKDRVVLPSPCIAPIVFVTSGGGSWFAATGF